MKKELIDFLLVVKEIAVDVVTAFTEQSENAKKIADTFQRGIKAIDVLLGEDSPKLISLIIAFFTNSYPNENSSLSIWYAWRTSLSSSTSTNNSLS